MRPHAVDGEVEQDGFIDAMTAVIEYIEKHKASQPQDDESWGSHVISSAVRRGSTIATCVKKAATGAPPPTARVELRRRAEDVEVLERNWSSGVTVMAHKTAEPEVAATNTIDEGRSQGTAVSAAELKQRVQLIADAQEEAAARHEQKADA